MGWVPAALSNRNGSFISSHPRSAGPLSTRSVTFLAESYCAPKPYERFAWSVTAFVLGPGAGVSVPLAERKVLVSAPRTPTMGCTIRAGMAWWYREYAQEQTPQEREVYAHAEEGRRLQESSGGRP